MKAKTRLREIHLDDGDGWTHVLREYSHGRFHHEITTPQGKTVQAGETWLSESEVAYFLQQVRENPRATA